MIAIASSRLSEVSQKPGDCTTGVKRRRQFDLSPGSYQNDLVWQNG